MNFTKAKEKFDQFISKNYDQEDEDIIRKRNHTYGVVKQSENLAKALNLELEEVELAKLIALLHDIGRFEQDKIYNNFYDEQTIDHAELGVKLLFETNFIREFISEDKYDNVIKQAIKQHNKYQLEIKDLTSQELLHCKIIRDADKTDNFQIKLSASPYSMNKITEEQIRDSKISQEIYQYFLLEKPVYNPKRKTPADIWISSIAQIFDYNFGYSLKYIQEKNYINRIIDRFPFREEDTIQKVNSIRKIISQYLEKRLKQIEYEEKNHHK